MKMCKFETISAEKVLECAQINYKATDLGSPTARFAMKTNYNCKLPGFTRHLQKFEKMHGRPTQKNDKYRTKFNHCHPFRP